MRGGTVVQGDVNTQVICQLLLAYVCDNSQTKNCHSDCSKTTDDCTSGSVSAGRRQARPSASSPFPSLLPCALPRHGQQLCTLPIPENSFFSKRKKEFHKRMNISQRSICDASIIILHLLFFMFYVCVEGPL